MNLLRLESVGSVLDLVDNIVYPEMVDGSLDLEMGVHLDECSDEWVLGLSVYDRTQMSINNAVWSQTSNVLRNQLRFENEIGGIENL